MTDYPLPGSRPVPRLRLARAALIWERAWPACWPAVGVLGIFAALALFDLLPMLPGPLHLGVLVLLTAALLVALVHAGRAMAWPNPETARRRIEVASDLPHRPLQALVDRPSGELDPAMAHLWEAHRRKMQAATRRLRVGWPAAGLARRDPWGLRAVLTIALVLAVVDAGADWRERVVRALLPAVTGGSATAAASLDLWVTPPEYTGLAPQFLRPKASEQAAAGDGKAETIRIATGSKLLAQVHGGGGVPRLSLDGKPREFETIDKDNFRAAATLSTGKEAAHQTLVVSQDGVTLGSWPVEIVPDIPPTIAFAKPPQPTARAALRLDYKAGDDYGVETVKAVIRRAASKPDGQPGVISDEKIVLELPLPGLHLKAATGTSFQDLTPHPWAGLPVEIRLVASDALGQTGESAPVRMTLPERVFNNPIARAIIDQRKELAKDPGSREPAAEILGDLNEQPALYRDDSVVYLALATAQQQLRLAPEVAPLADIEQLMWDTALRIEDGRMSLAERELRRLQQQLQDALARNAPDPEIERLMQEMQQALDRYMQALAEQLKQHPEQAMQQPVDPSRVITSRDLQRMLDRARELARNGDREQARQLLSQLQNMLENLRTARPGQMNNSGNSQAQQMMRGMQQLMQRQQQLLDRSFRAQNQARTGRPGQNGQPGQSGRPGPPDPNGQPSAGEGDDPGNDPGDQMGDSAGQQEALRRMLGEMMRKLGENGDIPEPFGRAERAMRDAAGALQQGQPGQAIGPQSDALDQLQQAARDLARQMQRQMGAGQGMPGEEGVGATDREPRDPLDRDPLGRPTANDGTYDQGDVKIPDENVLQKSRQILDELRRRAGERSRPPIELDYIDRLLKRF